MHVRKIAALVITLVVAGSFALAASPASATRPPADSGDCGFSFSDSKPTVDTVKFTVTMTCTALVSKIYHGMTVQRNGTVIDKPRKTCVNSNHTTTFKCAATDSFSDPSGSQKYEVLDEYMVYGGIDGTLLFDGKRIWTFYS